MTDRQPDEVVVSRHQDRDEAEATAVNLREAGIDGVRIDESEPDVVAVRVPWRLASEAQQVVRDIEAARIASH